MGKSFTYDGFNRLVQSVGTDVSIPIRVVHSINQVAGRWTLRDQAGTFNGSSTGTAQVIDGIANVGGTIWLAPPALSINPPNPLIDADPVTGAELPWTHDGNNDILLTANLPTSETITRFSGSNGLLLSYQSTSAPVAGMQITTLTLTSPQPLANPRSMQPASPSAGCDVPPPVATATPANLNRRVYLPLTRR